MTTTAFLSMWISNVATTAMMIPIAQAVLHALTEDNNKVGLNFGIEFSFALLKYFVRFDNKLK